MKNNRNHQRTSPNRRTRSLHDFPSLTPRPTLPPDLAAQADALAPRDRARYEHISGFLRARRKFFARSGTIVQGWRYYAGRKLGPYARLAFRHHGSQQSLYLGRSKPLRKAVEALLAFLQKRTSQSRWLRRAIRAARAAMRRSKRALDRKLRAWGLWLKGAEFRGWRHLEEPITRSKLVAINVPRTHPSLRCPYLPPPGPPPLRKRRRTRRTAKVPVSEKAVDRPASARRRTSEPVMPDRSGESTRNPIFVLLESLLEILAAGPA